MGNGPQNYSGRATKPDVERRHPFREFANIMQNAGHPASRTASNDKREGPAGPGSASAAASATSQSNFIEDGVRSAYDVIDQYILHGQDIARQFSQPYTGGYNHGGANGTSGLGNPLGAFADMGRLGDIQARALRNSMDMLGTWFELVGLVTSPGVVDFRGAVNGEGATPQGSAAPASSSAPVAQPAEDSLQVNDVVYEIRSDKPVRVTATLNPGAYFRDLASHGLRSLDHAEVPALGVRFQTDQRSESLLVSIDVPPGTPAGIYTGLAQDRADDEILGSVRLEVI